jgi:hypothetical protein
MQNKLISSVVPNLHVVLVHLGRAPAPHLWVNLECLVTRFENIQFVFVSDRDHPQVSKIPKLILFRYEADDGTMILLKSLTHDSKFRSGFWKLTIERFIALKEFHKSIPNSRIMHIESDILLLPDFPFEVFSTLEKLAWQRVDASRDVASIFFSPKYSETDWFVNELMKLLQVNRSTTDMTGLNQIRTSNPERIKILPSFSTELGSEVVEPSESKESLGLELSDGVDLFKGIFDPAAFGMWLTGSDPRNYYGKQVLFDTGEILRGGTYVNPSNLIYVFNEPDRFYCQSAHGQVRIWSLHVHSKDVRLLGSKWQERLAQVVKYSTLNQVISEFRLKSLFILACSNVRDRTFLSWVLHIPKLRPISGRILSLRSIITNILR